MDKRATYNMLKSMGAISEYIEYDMYMKKHIHIIYEIDISLFSFSPINESTIGHHESTIGRHEVRVHSFTSFEMNLTGCNLCNVYFDDVEIQLWKDIMSGLD